MFAIPRLAIVCGLLIFPNGPLNVDRDNSDFPELFRPFKNLLRKIRDLLLTLSTAEFHVLEKLLCQLEEPTDLERKLKVFPLRFGIYFICSLFSFLKWKIISSVWDIHKWINISQIIHKWISISLNIHKWINISFFLNFEFKHLEGKLCKITHSYPKWEYKTKNISKVWYIFLKSKLYDNC